MVVGEYRDGALAAHFEHGIPENEHLLIKVLLPIDKSGDVAEWLWMEATSFHNGNIDFVVPEHMRSYTPYSAGQGFHVTLARIIDYVHVRADGTEGGETNRFPQTRPRARLVQNGPAQYQKACDDGKLPACVHLGVLYSLSEGMVKKDAPRAAALFQRACDGGETGGCLHLGALYAQGDGLVKDAAKAAALFHKACDGGDMEACSLLGGTYVLGQGVAKDSAKAAALFHKACDGGHMTACFQLGLLYRGGHGVAKDAARAKALIQKACDGGESHACEFDRALP
jgi:TPR repeat protein